jgi:predicted HicB family RNase H-like nuclease
VIIICRETRLRPSVRALAEKRAAEQDRSLASYISQLIVADDAEKKRPKGG